MTHEQRTTGGVIVGIFVFGGLALVVLALTAFFLCDGRVDRSAYVDKLRLVSGLQTEAEVDRLLLPYCQKVTVGSGEVRYIARPRSRGLCFCAPVTVNVVVIRTDSSGAIVSTEVNQKVGFPKDGPR